VQQELDRRRSLVLADQDRRMIGVVLERRGVRMVRARAAERVDHGAAVRALNPAIGRAELELGQLRHALDCVDGRKESRRVDAVERDALARGFDDGSLHVVPPEAAEAARFRRVHDKGGWNPPRYTSRIRKWPSHPGRS
jgi:hypothetical protein